jgi:hypothetical protein
MSVRHVLAALVFMASMTTSALSLEVSGRVTDENERSLSGMSVRLLVGSSAECLAETVTDDDGRYRFTLWRRGINLVRRDFTVEVLGDGLSSYVFTPASADVTFLHWHDVRDDVDFAGVFDFRNFQRLLRLTADDFPDLAGFDLVGDYVFLKVYTSDPEEPSVQDLIFLGRIASADSVLVDASITRSMTELQYEIFGTSNSVNGTIDVVGLGTETNDPATDCRTRGRLHRRGTGRRGY